MRLLLVAATPFEIAPSRTYLTNHFAQVEENCFQLDDFHVQLLTTGVGQMLTAYALSETLSRRPFDFLINAGVAGSFDPNLALGTVVNVISERFGDLGAEDQEGQLLDIHEDLKLIGSDELPFQQSRLFNNGGADYEFLPKVHGLTVNKVHGSTKSIATIRDRYAVDVESMEGIAFFYAALRHQIPFLEVRAISNYVEARNRDAWQLGVAIENLNDTLLQFIQSLSS
jgi:futalosine hydrolase